MDPILEKVIIAVVGVVVPALITWLGTQIVKYKKLNQEAEDRRIKTTIENSLATGLQPLQNDISGLKTDVSNMQTDIRNIKLDVTNMKHDISSLQTFETNFSTRLQPTQDEIEHLKDDITEILEQLRQQGIDLENICEKEKNLEHETRCAWRYRIRQLCHVYIARGYMSYDEFSQLQEMYNIYAAIGGNGQTKELYERTKQLEIKTDVEIAALIAQDRSHSCPIVMQETK